MPSDSNDKKSDSILNVLTKRLTQQGKGISSSSSSNLQDSINEAITSTQESGNLGSAALKIEGDREVAFMKDRAGETYTNALEERSGYATQVAGLQSLTETTEKSIRDLDLRYKQAILSNDSATAGRISELKVKKLEFQQKQEESYYSNLLAVGNLQQQALSLQQQSEQFYKKQKDDESRFVIEMVNSNLQYEKDYGLNLQEIGLKEQQLELERSKFNLSVKEYGDRKKALTVDKSRLSTQAIIAQDIKNKMATGQFTKEQFLDTNYLSTVIGMTEFDGTTEELSSLILGAYSTVEAGGAFNPAASISQESPARVGGLINQPGLGKIGEGASVLGSLISEGLLGTPSGQTPMSSQIDWIKFSKELAKTAGEVTPIGRFY